MEHPKELDDLIKKYNISDDDLPALILGIKKKEMSIYRHTLNYKLSAYLLEQKLSKKQFAKNLNVSVSYLELVLNTNIKVALRRAYVFQHETQNAVTITDFGYDVVDVYDLSVDIRERLKHFIAKNNLSYQVFSRKIKINTTTLGRVMDKRLKISPVVAREILIVTGNAIDFFDDMVKKENRQRKERMDDIQYHLDLAEDYMLFLEQKE